MECMGSPTPIVPVPVGADAVGRVVSRLIQGAGLLVNFVEYPAVAVGASRVRLQVQTAHTAQDAQRAAEIFANAVAATHPIGRGPGA